MNVVILVAGSRGDVQPYVALGRGLRRAGHGVIVATHAHFAPLVTTAGLGFHRVTGDPVEAMHRLRPAMTGGRTLLRFLPELVNFIRPQAAQARADLTAACAGADLVVKATLTAHLGQAAAAARGIPAVTVAIYPAFHATRAFPHPAFPQRQWGPAYNRLTHHIFRWAFQQAFGRLTGTRWPFEGPTAYIYSPSVVPPPPDWPADVAVTGYCFLDEPEWEPPDSLLRFLDAGAPPVVFGFGSVPDPDPEGLTAIALNALRETGLRAIFLTGWGGLRATVCQNGVLALDSVPHAWLFPRVAAVVHHGGSGTTGAAVRAGIPSIVVPYFADQPFWARRLHALGVAPRPLSRHRLTVKGLTAALVHATGPQMSASARTLGEGVRAEDGVTQAVHALEAAAASIR